MLLEGLTDIQSKGATVRTWVATVMQLWYDQVANYRMLVNAWCVQVTVAKGTGNENLDIQK